MAHQDSPKEVAGPRLLAIGVAIFLVSALLITSCGRATTAQAPPSATPTGAPSGTPEPSPTLPSVSPTPSPAEDRWQTYRDAKYGYELEFPPNFVVEEFAVGSPRTPGELRLLRFVDRAFVDSQEFPPGQVDLGVYSKDAKTLSAWLTMHSRTTCRTSSCPTSTTREDADDRDIYFLDVENIVETQAAGRPGVTFDWHTGEGDEIHALIFFHRSVVIRLDWWGEAYEPTIQPVFARMVASFRDVSSGKEPPASAAP